MTKEQFDWAWDQAPDPEIAESFLEPNAPVLIGNPLDRKWLYHGTVPRNHVEYRIPCRCGDEARKKAMMTLKPQPLVPNPFHMPIVICPGGTLHINGKHAIYYVGVCDDCGTVYWLTEE